MRIGPLLLLCSTAPCRIRYSHSACHEAERKDALVTAASSRGNECGWRRCGCCAAQLPARKSARCCKSEKCKHALVAAAGQGDAAGPLLLLRSTAPCSKVSMCGICGTATCAECASCQRAFLLNWMWMGPLLLLRSTDPCKELSRRVPAELRAERGPLLLLLLWSTAPCRTGMRCKTVRDECNATGGKFPLVTVKVKKGVHTPLVTLIFTRVIARILRRLHHVLRCTL
jgi:hypothetical protein